MQLRAVTTTWIAPQPHSFYGDLAERFDGSRGLAECGAAAEMVATIMRKEAE